MGTIMQSFFTICPRSNKVVGLNTDNKFIKILFPLLGIAALIWFLFRVIPKPSRIDYPCQKVAAPIAFSMISLIAGDVGLAFVVA